MSASERLQGSVAALGDKELEILRLLAAGHTVKSIAARLGRSESAINERLRDARRKTGIGSSRELARLVAAQKIWDKNIGLSADRLTTDEGAPPANRLRVRSKGTLIMLIALPLAAAGIAVTAANSIDRTAHPPVAQQAPKALPLVGRWSLDVSRIPVAERPRSVTIAFAVGPDRKWTTTVDIVGPDGVARHAESTAGVDGVPVTVTGNMDFIDTVSLRRPAPNTLVMTLGKNGAPVSTRVYTVARDGKSMTETIVWASTGMPALETTYFTRIG